MMDVIAAGTTDKGCVRQNNEDAILVRPDLKVFAVADGMGGAAAGEVASRIFIDTVAQVFATSDMAAAESTNVVKRCFHLANQGILDHSDLNPDTKGMGCTAEILLCNNDNYIVGHVGDSRSYLFREGQLQQLTTDHSYVQQQMDLGLLHPDEARSHYLKNAIYRAVGVDEDISVDIIEGRLRDNDLFLLCSDGLTDMVETGRIEELLRDVDTNIESSMHLLVEEAKSNGGRDNISLILCRAQRAGIFSRFLRPESQLS